MELILSFICGVICCVVVVSLFRKHIFRKKTMGVLQIDRSDPDGPYLFLANAEHPDVIAKGKYAIFEVEVTKYLSQD